MNNLALACEEFSGWACELGKNSVTIEEMHGENAVEVTIPRPENLHYCDGMPVRVLHIHAADGQEIVELVQAS